jgi:hypothetical protein
MNEVNASVPLASIQTGDKPEFGKAPHNKSRSAGV